MVKTTDLILGLPPTSLQEMTASSLADYFVGKHGTPDLSPYTPQPNQVMPQTNRSVADARNPAELAAAQLALRLPQGIDKGGDILPAVERLQRQGAMEAGDPNIVPQPASAEHTLADASPASADAVETGDHGSLHTCVQPSDTEMASAIEPLAVGGAIGLPSTAATQAAGRAAAAAAVVALLVAAAAGARRRRRTPQM
jgi:hypothetical protein